jgi:hypothetical protein
MSAAQQQAPVQSMLHILNIMLFSWPHHVHVLKHCRQLFRSTLLMCAGVHMLRPS